jgi:hypothetical protein
MVQVQIKETNDNLKNYNMEGLTINQIYRESGVSNQGITFKDWLASENALYDQKVENGKVADMPFNEWLQVRWDRALNASGKKKEKSGKGKEVLASLKDIGKQVLQKTVNTKSSGTTASDSPSTDTYQSVEKRILGMKPVVFYSIAGVVGLGAIFVTVVIIKKIRKKP